MVKVRIAFGADLVSKWNWEGEIDTDCGYLKVREFNTQAEADAYISGLDDALDWDDLCIASTPEEIVEFDKAYKDYEK